MKKFCLVLTVVILFSLAACGKTESVKLNTVQLIKAENKDETLPSGTPEEDGNGENAETPSEKDENAETPSDGDKTPENGEASTPAAPSGNTAAKPTGGNKTPSSAGGNKKPSQSGSPANPATCKHPNAYRINAREATCEDESYTGDLYCPECDTVVANGEYGKLLGHSSQLTGKKAATYDSEGYTGDWICTRCKKISAKGTVIPKKKRYTATHDYYDIEMEVLRLINEERKKVGVSPLEWDEELYPGAKIRVKECQQKWGHTRPNGSSFITAIVENSNYTTGDFTTWGENLTGTSGPYDVKEIAKDLFTKWYNSPGHKDNMLYSGFNRTAIAVFHPDYNYEYDAINVFVGIQNS